MQHALKLQSFADNLDRMLQLTDVAQLQAALKDLESEFKAEIMPLSADASDLGSQWVSYLTEMHKQMRLLQTESIFLQSARQPDKVSLRLANIRQCLTKLQSYCEVLLGN